MPVDRNRAPVTVLTGVPGDSTTNFYRLHLYWSGYDPDGEVVGFEWAITDTCSTCPREPVWRYTTRTDSIFRFNVEENREVLGHRFYLRAVDNEGKRDPIPKWTFFAVRNNCSPTSRFLVARAFGPNQGDTLNLTSTNPSAPGDTIPAGWGLYFSWEGADCDQAMTPGGQVETVGQVVGFDHKLLPVELNWLRGPATETSASYAAADLRSDAFEMRVRARDDGGLTGSDPAVRAFVWNFDPITGFDRALLPGHPDSVPVFKASVSGTTGEYLPYTDGDTLPLVPSGVTIRAVVRAEDPDAPHRIDGVEARLVKDMEFWSALGPNREFTDGNRPNFTGSFSLMARSLDGLGRWDGTPAVIRFTINKRARFRDTWTNYSELVTQRPAEGAVYRANGQDTMMMRFAAWDPDYSTLVNPDGLEFITRWEAYPLPSGGQGSEVDLDLEWVNGAYVAGPDTTFALPYSLTVAHLPPPAEGEPALVFIPGEYAFAVRTRETFPSQESRDRYGSREAERVVRFRLQ